MLLLWSSSQSWRIKSLCYHSFHHLLADILRCGNMLIGGFCKECLPTQNTGPSMKTTHLLVRLERQKVTPEGFDWKLYIMVSKVVIVVVLVLDIIAFGLAVNAERRRNTVQVIADRELDYKYCRYSQPNVATGYGFGAFFCLFVSQIIIMVASRCLCCGKSMKPGGSRACAIILFIFCWLTFIIAELCLLAASVKNSHRTKYRSFFGGQAPSCEFLRKGVFAAGAAFTFFTAIFSEFSTTLPTLRQEIDLHLINLQTVQRCHEKTLGATACLFVVVIDNVDDLT
ncbi:hypothetical protein RDABS01_032499 [Bienertia sinuspersici]